MDSSPGLGDRLLDQMMEGSSTSQSATGTNSSTAGESDTSGASSSPPSNVTEHPRLRYRHQALIDLMITRPELDQNDYARMLGYTPSWLSTIIMSDSFQMALAERREEIVDPQVRATLEEQFKGIVARSLEILRKKLDKPPDEVESQLALRAMEISSRALGYGARPAEPPRTGDLHIHLENLGENLVAVLRKKKQEVVEGEVVGDVKV